jgi:hypothetical protein
VAGVEYRKGHYLLMNVNENTGDKVFGRLVQLQNYKPFRCIQFVQFVRFSSAVLLFCDFKFNREVPLMATMSCILGRSVQ